MSTWKLPLSLYGPRIMSGAADIIIGEIGVVSCTDMMLMAKMRHNVKLTTEVGSDKPYEEIKVHKQRGSTEEGFQ